MYSAYLVCLSNIKKGTQLKLNGVGFRLFTNNDYLVLNLGYSHYLVSILDKNQAIKGKRQRMFVEKSMINRFLSYRKCDPYKHRGMQNLSVNILKKEGKKR